MPSLKKMLQACDLDMLERISRFWGVDSHGLDASGSVKALMDAMLDASLREEVVESLPEDARQAWRELQAASQPTTWSVFTRKYGEVREFGPSKRERETPDRKPVSVSEMLWYRALIGRAFMNLPPEPREFVYIPEELLGCKENHPDKKAEITPTRMDVHELTALHQAGNTTLDALTDWLAAKRMGRDLPENAWKFWKIPETFMLFLARQLALLNADGDVTPDSLPDFFQAADQQNLLNGFSAWLESDSYNDLRQLSGLIFEGDWKNDPLRPRRFLMELLGTLTPGEWYSLPSLVNSIKTRQPDFQRPSGDYDSWFIRDAQSNAYLRGVDHWDRIDGALLHYLIRAPLHWLGICDLALTKATKEIAFRLTPLFKALPHGKHDPSSQRADKPLKFTSDLGFVLPMRTSRMLRYQIARFCDLRSVNSTETTYQITANSMMNAQQHGLKPSQLIHLLEKQGQSALPAALLRFVEQWEAVAQPAQVSNCVILHTPTPRIMEHLLDKALTARYIVEKLTPQTAIIHVEGVAILRKEMLEQGVLTALDPDV